jgi:prepilin-type N-terminal cleavage/methylation domain-containing protein
MYRFWLRAFTLVEIMVVLALIGILAGSLFPQVSSYISRGRDISRLSDIKVLSAKFQNYMHDAESYPNNTNKDGVTSYCLSEIMLWENAVALYVDKQYSLLWWTGALLKDPTNHNPSIGPCWINGSYFYSRIDYNGSYGVLAARMENQTTWANWTWAYIMTQSGNVNAMQSAGPLDKHGNDADKLFILITN